jgi:regulator of sigma E protease
VIQSPSIFVTVAAFLLVIGPLIFFHELGHYLVGRLFGVHAEVFSIGFGKEIFGWNDRRGTRWKVAWLPLGGYVRFAGDMNPASVANPEWLALPPEERARTFQGKALWQRFLIVLAGPATNFLLAIIIIAGFFATFGELRTPPVVNTVQPGSAAAAAGIRPGDRITMIARRGIDSFEDVASIVMLFPGEQVPLDVYRGKQQIHMLVTPKRVAMEDRFGNRADIGRLGITPGPQVIVPLKPHEVIGAAIRHTGSIVVTMVQTLTQIATGTRDVSELGGPVKIAKFAGEQITTGWLPFIEFMAMISINLGFINLLPIPLLDGGHLFFYVLEGIRRRPLGPRTQEWAFRVGLAILLPFILFVTFNDFGIWQRLAGLIG